MIYLVHKKSGSTISKNIIEMLDKLNSCDDAGELILFVDVRLTNNRHTASRMYPFDMVGITRAVKYQAERLSR
jgi:hypothetical protein